MLVYLIFIVLGATTKNVPYLSSLLAPVMNHCIEAVQAPTAEHLG